ISTAAARTLAERSSHLDAHARHTARAVQTRLTVEDHRLQVVAGRAGRAAPAALERGRAAVERRAGRAEGAARAHLRVHARSLDLLAARVGPAASGAARRAEARLEAAGTHLHALDPARALARGWSITRTATGSVVRQSTDV